MEEENSVAIEEKVEKEDIAFEADQEVEAKEDIKDTKGVKKKAKKKKKHTKKKTEKDAGTVAKEAEGKNDSGPREEEELGIPKEVIFGAIIVIAVLAAVALTFNQAPAAGPQGASPTTTISKVFENPDMAEMEDIVTVDYIGSFENGTVFDTSLGDTAEEAGIKTSVREYKPLMFTLGYGGLIKGFESSIKGMRIGEEKEVTIPPEDAYGFPRGELVRPVPKHQISSATQNVSIERFKQEIGQEPKVGLIFNVPESTDYSLDWPVEILSVDEETVIFQYKPDGAEANITTVFGPARVYGEGDNIVIDINARVGQKIMTLNGPAEVVKVDDENITIDFNHPLTGKTLKFWLKLLDVTKQ